MRIRIKIPNDVTSQSWPSEYCGNEVDVDVEGVRFKEGSLAETSWSCDPKFGSYAAEIVSGRASEAVGVASALTVFPGVKKITAEW